MATIFYSLMGEGRGHAARARAMTEQLRDRHRIVIYTSHDALAFLSEIYANDDHVEVRETPGIIMEYTNGRLDLRKTVTEGLVLRWNLARIVEGLLVDFERDRPAAVVTDFEPTVPRAAHRCGVPVMSFDHQHFIVAYDLSRLPLRLRSYAWAMHPFVKAFGLRQEKTVVSAFYFPPLRPAYRDAVQVGPILRPLVREAHPTLGDHVLCYFRRHTPERIVDLMTSIDRPVRIYGLEERPQRENLTFLAIDERGFINDLASAYAVIGAAGNQLSGETLYFGKPFLAIPEKNHHEQCINAYFVKDLGGGDWRLIETITADDIQQFMGELETYRENLCNSPHKFDGTDDAAREIEAFVSANS
jgi:uncharacterized protein (TIGR00661 family)